MDRLDKPYIPKKPKFFFNFTWELPEKILNFKELFIWREEPLFFIPEAILYWGQRIWIVWENWAWKSTFLKSIIWEIEYLEWFHSKWKWVQICYYSQMHEELDKSLTVRKNFEKQWFNFADQQLIAILRHYLFDPTDIDKNVSELSGWQTSKLLFALLWQRECGLLILDEPTNHLDYDTRESLEEALREFKWSILFISHDRYFVNKLATNIWFIEDWELSISYWNYEDYQYKKDHNIDMDINMFDEEAELNMVLEEKLWENEFKRLKNKFEKKKNRRQRWRK
jgi:ATP-binding cassette subfamily F protein 3